MKKILGVISWIIAIAGVGGICVSVNFVDNYVIFYVGWGLLIVGIISILLTCEKSRKWILELFNFI